jgi:hypothetical protein
VDKSVDGRFASKIINKIKFIVVVRVHASFTLENNYSVHFLTATR